MSAQRIHPDVDVRHRLLRISQGLFGLQRFMQGMPTPLLCTALGEALSPSPVPVLRRYGDLSYDALEPAQASCLRPQAWHRERDVLPSLFLLLPMSVLRRGRILLTCGIGGELAECLRPQNPPFTEVLLLSDLRWVWVGPRSEEGLRKWPTYALFDGLTAAYETWVREQSPPETTPA